MSHQDGRCATDAETIYVQNATGCSTGQQGGTAQVPFCSFDPVPSVLTAQRSLIVARGVLTAPSWTLQGQTFETTLVGQQGAALGAGASPAMHVSGAPLYVRAVQLVSALDVGIVADTNAVLRLDSVTVQNSAQGGISIDSSNFDIENSAVSGNGPGTEGATTWGGVLVLNPPATGAKRLANLSVTNNKGPGVSCSSGIVGVAVFATGNSPVDVASTCGFTACSPAGPTCGAQ
jgi:hypothetical protein